MAVKSLVMGSLGVAAVAGVLVLLYLGHVRSAAFAYEDEDLIPRAGASASLAFQGRRLTHWTWGYVQTPQAAHALSLGLHIAIVGLVGILGWQLLGSTLGAIGAAAIAGLHPLQTQAIAYAAERDDLIAAIGVLATLICVASGRWWLWLCAPVFAGLAYMGKETGLAVVGLVPLVLWLQGRLREWTLWLGALAAWIGLVVYTNGQVIAGLRAVINIGESDLFQRVTVIEWVPLQATAVYRLLVLSVVPWPGWLTPDPDIAIVPVVLQVGAVVLLAGLVESAWRLRRSRPYVAFGIAWCLAAVALRFVVQTPWSYVNGGHWYLSLIGLSLAAGAWIAGVKEPSVCL